jgi:hypothetical protein
LKVSAANPGDTIASHNATALIRLVALIRSIESSSSPHEYHILRLQQDTEKVPSPVLFIWFVWFVWFFG